MKPTKVSETHPDDLLNAGHSKSASDEFYKFMLQREKLNAILPDNDFLNAGEQAALTSISTREKVELKTLARLYQLEDTSPEFLQVKAITGGRDREDIAAKLTQKYLEKVQVEDVLNRFLAPDDNRTRIRSALQASRASYDAFA